MNSPPTFLRSQIVLAMAVGLVSCASLVKPPQVAFTSVGIHSVGLIGATVRVELQVSNPNRFSLDARAMDYTLSFAGTDQVGPEGADGMPDEAWQSVATGRTAQGVGLGAGDTVPVTVEVPFRYSDVGRAVASLLQNGRLHYRFHGAFAVGSPVGELRIPFDTTGLLDP